MSNSTFVVSGMTCGGCVGTVKSEVAKVAGVSAVEIELATGKLTVTGEGPIDEVLVRNAVEEAGYELTAV